MQIVVPDGHMLNPGDNPWDAVAALGDFTLYDLTAEDKIIERMIGADIAVTNKVPFSKEILEKLPNLKFIAVTATGYNIVDLSAAKTRGIPVSNVPEYGTNSVAQVTFALILELTNSVGHHSSAVHSGRWSGQPHVSFWEKPQIELVGKKIGIIGYGRIGKRVADIAAALKMKVLTAGRDPVRVREVISQSDIVTLHCPLTEENTGMVNREFLTHMKSSAFFINTARGGLVVEQDLADALNGGKIAGAAVDVVSIEPIRQDNPLLKAKNCIITPHIAWASLEARKRLMQATAENIRAFFAGTPTNVVNP